MSVSDDKPRKGAVTAAKAAPNGTSATTPKIPLPAGLSRADRRRIQTIADVVVRD